MFCGLLFVLLSFYFTIVLTFYFHVLSTDQRICNQINTTDATSEVGTADHSEESKSSPIFNGFGHSLVL